MSRLLQDICFGLRMLGKNPGFSAVAVTTLALAIGMATLIFSITDAFLLKPLKFPHLDRLVMVREATRGSGWMGSPMAPADYLDWKKQTTSFESISAYRWTDGLNITGGPTPELLLATRVFPNFFATLGVNPVLGRGFTAHAGEAGYDAQVVLSEHLWRSRFGSNPEVVGQTVVLNDRAYTVTGVMGKDFEFPLGADVWIPLVLSPSETTVRGARDLSAVARLKPSVSKKQALAEMSVFLQLLAREYPDTNSDWHALLVPVREFVTGNLTRAYTSMLMAGACFILLIACANVSNMQFARSITRHREFAVRTALGANRRRIACQLLTESTLLGVTGAILGLALASWGIDATLAAMPADVARWVGGWNAISLDRRALAFTMATAVVSGILSGLLPALRTSNPDLNESLKEGGRGVTGGRGHHRWRNGLVVGQVALAVILLAGAGLIVKGFRAMVQSEAQFDPGHVLQMNVSLPASHYSTPALRARFYRQTLEKFQSIPGVQSSASFSLEPLSNGEDNWIKFRVEGITPSDAKRLPAAELVSMTPSYLHLMQIPLLRGRSFTVDDTAQSLPVALVSQNLARSLWHRESPIGKHIHTIEGSSESPWLTVVGVTGDVEYDWTDNQPEPAIYRPCAQDPFTAMSLALRTRGDAASLARPARRAISSLDRELPASGVMTLEKEMGENLVGFAYLAVFMGVLGVMALILASLGVYGVMAYSVSERTHEIGIRMALGASRQDVLGMVVRRGMSLNLVGLAIGLPCAYMFARLLSSILYGVTANDAMVLCGVPMVLAAIGLLACYTPARRAATLDPTVALRRE